MYCKRWIKYLLVGILLIIFSAVCFAPVNIVLLNNETFFSTVVGFKVQDWSVCIAFVVGICSIMVALFSTEKSYNAVKLSSIPEKSVNLLIDLEFLFNEYGDGDKLILLTEILKYWKNHQNAFRLLTPNFYKNFLKIISNGDTIKDDDSIPEINSKYILCAIKAQISNVAFENERIIFSFIKPELIGDDKNLKDVGENIKNYIEFKIEKIYFENYMNDFKGKDTHDKTLEKFKKFYSDVEGLLDDLRKEIGEYG